MPHRGAVRNFPIVAETRHLRVLIVCSGNTCRSAMAEVVLRRLLEEAGRPAEVRSAGTHALAGAPANPEAVAAVAAAGLDLTAHRTQPLTSPLVGWADVILGMQPAHIRSVLEIDPAAPARLVTAFDPNRGGGRGGIRDPFGGPSEMYAEVLAELQSCLSGFIREGPSPAGSG
ncbi:MAG: low molecular weight protein arginine phosphatase [Gemmatimonadota bacterium]